MSFIISFDSADVTSDYGRLNCNPILTNAMCVVPQMQKPSQKVDTETRVSPN